MPRSLIVSIFGDAKQFGAELDKAAGKTRSLGKVAGVAGLAIAGGLAYGLEKSVKAAEAAQTSTARLDKAFTASGQSMGKFTSQIDTAEASGRKLGFSNIDIRTSLGSLEVATKNGTKAISELQIAEDLARFTGKDLGATTKMLTMAQAGSQRAMKALGLSIQPVTSNYDQLKATMGKHIDATEKAALATAKLIDKQATAAEVIKAAGAAAAGQADAFSQTAQGGMQQFHAQTEALQESLGTALLPALTVVAQELATVAEYFSKHATLAKVLVAALGGLAAVLLTVSIATKIVAAAQLLYDAALAPVTATILLVVAALAILGIAIYEIVKHWAAIKAATIETWNTIKEAVTGAANAVKNAITGAFDTVLTWVRAHWPLLVGLLTGPVGLAVAEIVTHWNAIVTGVRNALGDVVAFFKALPGRILAAVGDLSHLLWNEGASIISGLVQGATSAVGSKLNSLKSAVESKLHSIVSTLNPFSSVEHGGYIHIGQPLAWGTIKGWLDGISPLEGIMKNSIQGAVISAGGFGMDLWATIGSGLQQAAAQAAGAASLHAAIAPAIAGPTNTAAPNVNVNFPNYVGTKSDLTQLVTSAVVAANRTGNLLSSDIR